MSMVCQRDQRECGTSKPWVHDVLEGPERGWDQQTLGQWCARGGWDQQTLRPWCARGTRERVGPANPGSMVCQRDQRGGGTSIFMSMVCQRDQRECGTSKPWVHDVPEGPEREWDLGPWCARWTRERVGPANPCPWSARGTRERVGPANHGSMVCQRDQREGGTICP